MLFGFLEKKTPRIAIIGAGLAGLRAARHFEQVGIDYLIFEGSNRIGGRVYPFKFQNGYLQFGAEYVNGVDNEIYRFFEKHELFDKKKWRTNDLWMLDEGVFTVIDGKLIDGEKLEIWKEFVKTVNEKLYEEAENDWKKSVAEKIDEKFSEFLIENPSVKNDIKVFENLCKLYKNYFQTEWSSPAEKLGMKNFHIWDDGTNDEDSAVLNEFGFQKILEKFQKIIPADKILLNTKVINVNYEDVDALKILLENEEILQFDSVIVTSSLGFLKKNQRKLFSPFLPLNKEEAIERMGFGSNMKVFLEYKVPWWPSETSTITISTTEKNSKLTDNLMIFQPCSWAKNVLIAWIAGCGPYEVSQKTDKELKEIIDFYLKTQLDGHFRVGKISNLFRHNWISDEFALGSYSFLSAGSDKNDIEIIGEPIFKGDRPLICFAGEHTDPEIYQTTVGAARSGLREAIRIHLFYSETSSNN